jgi:multidrug transporter EmrE-like cation transporter
MWLVVWCTALLAGGQVLLKLGVRNGASTLIGFATSGYIILGGVLYVLATIFMTVALKYGDLSVLYPLIALGFVWVGIASYFVLGEPFGAMKIIGTAAIIGGVSLVGRARR